MAKKAVAFFRISRSTSSVFTCLRSLCSSSRSALAGLPSTGLVLVVYKGARTLAVYRDGRFDRRYAVVLGKQPNGRKRYQGDMRTPEGLYHVKSKSRHPRWRHR